MKLLHFFIIALFFLASLGARAGGPIYKLRSLRIDPAYFAIQYPNLNIEEIAKKIIDNAISAGTDSIFLYAYSPQNGAFYQTNYPQTEVEPLMGSVNAFGVVAKYAKAQGLRVFAVLPINDFRKAWEEHPDWRSKNKNGTDYRPFARTHYLSAWHPEYQKWFKGFIDDFLNRFPEIYALEVVEPTVDCFWTGDPDYNIAARKDYFKKFPKGTLGDQNWKIHRAQGLTELIAQLATQANGRKVHTSVVQTWPAAPSGLLFSSDFIRDHVGFNFNDVLNLKGDSKVIFVVAELLWQQWAAEYDKDIFRPEWTRKAAQTFIGFVGNRAVPILHVEISPWKGTQKTVTPTLDEFKETLLAIREMKVGIDVYDYHQLQERNAWDELSHWRF